MLSLMSVKAQDTLNYIYVNNLPYAQEIVLGDTFAYDFNVDTDQPDLARFDFAIFDAMTYEQIQDESIVFDELTGEFSWTPAQPGMYFIGVFVYLDGYDNIGNTSYFELQVWDPEDMPCATISGNVTDIETGEPIPYANVSIIESRADGTYMFSFSTTTDELGDYSATVPEGTYIVSFDAYNYEYAYYTTDDDPNTPALLELLCNTTTTIDMALYPKEAPPPDSTYTIYFTTWIDYQVLHQGETFIYDANAIDIYDRVVAYSMPVAPEGATIDSETGVITWNITEALEDGYYDFQIIASLADGSEPMNYAEQYFSVYVGGISPYEPCSYINGTVLDQDGEPVAYATVNIYSAYDNQEPIRYSGYFSISTSEDGSFEFFVPEGEYILYVEGWGLIVPEFYQDTDDPSQATILEAICEGEISLTINVERLPEPVYYTVSGSVTDQETGEPVMAYVEFYSDSPYMYNDIFCPPMVATDENGEYSIVLLGNYEYRAVAVPFYRDYIPEFYLEASDFTTATPFELTGDMENINFTLQAYPSYENSITGTLVNPDLLGIGGYVIAFRLYEDNYDLYWDSYTAIAEAEYGGAFTFTNLVPDDYVLFAIPESMLLVPGFYVEDDFATWFWENATILTIGEETNLDGIQIMLADADTLLGICRLEGYIDGNGSAIQMKKDQPLGSETGLKGAFMTVVNPQTNKVIAYTFSENTGKYLLEKIAAGKMQVNASKVGFNSFSTEVDFDNLVNVSQTKNIILNVKTTSDVDEPETDYTGLIAYPNPATNSLTINLSDMSGFANISLFNLQGEELLFKTIDNGGEYLTLDVTAIPSGSYIVKVSSNGKSVQSLVQIIK
jgi:hypothetical protein